MTPRDDINFLEDEKEGKTRGDDGFATSENKYEFLDSKRISSESAQHDNANYDVTSFSPSRD